MRFISTMLAVVVLAVTLAACGQAPASSAASSAPAGGSSVGKVVTTDGGSYRKVAPTELNNMLASKDFAFVNVHIPYEGDLAKTDASIPYNEIAKNLTKLPADKNAKIVLYCRSGRMSTEAAQELVKLGYTNVYNLDGGMIAWEQAGYPVIRK
ncbi:MAG: rhodanese-like domain-containing protein [Anaerolineae bacterium]